MNYFTKKKERNQIGNVTTHFKFKRKRKKLYYYLPTSIECTPIFYSKKKKTKESCCTVLYTPETENQTCYRHPVGSQGYRLNFKEKREAFVNGWEQSY